MLLDPLSSINKIFPLVIQQERQFAYEGILESKHVVNVSNSIRGNLTKALQGRGTGGFQNPSRPPTPVGRGTTKRVCTFCGKNGHTIDV